MLEDILLQVNKPGRYIGGEWNLHKKDFTKSDIKFALCFPDLYELGMSNLGMRILYGILNKTEDVSCERFFAPGIDLEDLLRKNNQGIFSLESKIGLREFDIVGFSLGYELGYTNVLNILDLGQMPLEAALRGNDYPLVIGGGPCVMNPEPMHKFFDLFVIGEAEEAILEIVDLYRNSKKEFKQGRISKQDLLVKFSEIEGVYVPSLYDVSYDSSGKINEFKPRIKDLPCAIKKRFIKNLDESYFPLDWLIPYIQIVHDRITLEVMRGCPNRCRFCQARHQYFPFRTRNISNILNLADKLYRCTGYDEVSLGGLSVSDYPDIEKLLQELVGLFKERAVSLSLPSIKPKTMVKNFSALIAAIKKTGFTFAPEAATERMRNILGKDFDLEDFFKALEQAYLNGWQHIKLYFMIGLPFEETGDLDAILDFATEVSLLRKKVAVLPAFGQKPRLGPAQVNISINTLIPKPHTPFQWLKMEGLESIRYKQEHLRRKTKNKRLKLNFHNPYMGFLEGVFSRGDRRLSDVILLAFKKGARFDAWSEHFVFDRWLGAFKELNIEPDFYLRERPIREPLPWDFIDLGVNKELLEEEYNKLIALK